MRRLVGAVAALGLLLTACSSTYEVATTVVSGEHTQDIWVTAPNAPDSDEWGTWPVVFALHGLGGSGEALERTAQALAREGVVVFAPDYRSTQPFNIEEDAECAYRYAMSIAADYGGDISRPITAIGHSLGATVSLYGGLSEDAYGPDGTYGLCYDGTPRTDLIVAISGCHYEFEGNPTPMDMSGFSNRDAEIVMVVGSDDLVCEPWQSQDATEAYASEGYETRLVEIAGGNHANVIYFEITAEDEWLPVDEDPVGDEVVQVILDAMEQMGR